MIRCDVAIIGGSIAGNYLASLIAGPGMSVHVFEAHYTPGLPVECAGIVSSKILELLPVPRGAIVNRVREARVVAPGKQRATITTRDEPVVLDRERLDRYFYHVATRRGAIYHLNERVIAIEMLRDKVIIHSTRATCEARLVAGCDGAHSIVAKSLGITHGFVTGKQAVVTVPEPLRALVGPAHACELAFHPAWGDLFGWIVPAGNGQYRIGLAARKGVATAFHRFVTWRFGAAAPDVLRGATITGGTVPGGLPVQCAFHRAILLGDAACQVKATTGGGLVMLATAARIAAGAIRRGIEQGKFSRRFFTRHYQRPCARAIGTTLKVHYIVHEALRLMHPVDFNTLIAMSAHPRVRHELRRVADMDFPLPFLVKVASVPAFYTWLAGFARRNGRLVAVALAAFLFSKELQPS